NRRWRWSRFTSPKRSATWSTGPSRSVARWDTRATCRWNASIETPARPASTTVPRRCTAWSSRGTWSRRCWRTAPPSGRRAAWPDGPGPGEAADMRSAPELEPLVDPERLGAYLAEHLPGFGEGELQIERHMAGHSNETF